MDHFYQKIENWFDYQDIFSEVINKANNKSLFVEIGIWKGGSSAYMGVEIINSGKKIYYDAIDTFEGSEEHGNVGIFLYDECKNNLKHLIDIGIINLIKAKSPEISNNYQDKSIDFCFIDGSHKYQDIKLDIISWLPKVKKGGILAGHDYYPPNHPSHNIGWPGVFKAVDEIFGYKNVENRKNSWLYYV